MANGKVIDTVAEFASARKKIINIIKQNKDSRICQNEKKNTKTDIIECPCSKMTPGILIGLNLHYSITTQK